VRKGRKVSSRDRASKRVHTEKKDKSMKGREVIKKWAERRTTPTSSAQIPHRAG
jgi:hypothetical protein